MFVRKNHNLSGATGIKIEVDSIYRFLDKLNKSYKETAERIAFEYTKRTLKNITSGKLTKSNINNRGYNKFLELDGKMTASPYLYFICGLCDF